MEDQDILQLYQDRDEAALTETAQKYGAYCGAIARNILGNREDAEECLNDTWLRAWNAIPPRCPNPLSGFLGAVTRNLAFDRWQRLHAQKRGGGQTALALEELGECVSGRDADSDWERRELEEALRAFVKTLAPDRREMFLRRYWRVEPVSEIARRFGRTENQVSTILYRIRKKLKAYLIERGFEQ